MGKSLYSFAEVEAKTAKPTTLTSYIRNLLRDVPECYAEIEPYLMPPGVTGSRQFDQANCVLKLLQYDKEHGNLIAGFMAEHPHRVSHLTIWNTFHRVLKQAGFHMSHGRLIGLVEDLRTKEEKARENGEPGQPDID